MPPIAKLTRRPGAVPVHLGLHVEDRRHRGRPRQGAGDHLQHVLRRAVHGAPPGRLRPAAEGEGAALRRRLLAGEHRLGRRAVRRRQAHQHPLHPRDAQRRPERQAQGRGVHTRTRCSGSRCRRRCPDVPAQVLDPAGSWPNRELYTQRYRQLAARFIDNFKKFDGPEAREVEQSARSCRSTVGRSRYRAYMTQLIRWNGRQCGASPDEQDRRRDRGVVRSVRSSATRPCGPSPVRATPWSRSIRGRRRSRG